MNRRAFRLALETGLALGCDISPFTKWDRKQYYYPDLPKAYQISQYDLPFSHDGHLKIPMNPNGSETRKIGIIRAHLEEDAGKNLHDESGKGGDSRVDLNRCGTPLLEIVSEPDLRSAQEAKKYLEELKLLLTYLGVSDCNMQEGSLRCDANVNLHIHTDDGQTIATPIVEVKNLNSFRGVEQAVEYESKRQFDEWQQTGRKLGDPGVEKETRGWDANRGVTFAQRGKEEASDYRYFPDPDLVPVTVSEEEIEEIRQRMCEFPADRRKRFREAYQLSDYDVAVIIDQGPAFADYFEQVATRCGDGKQAANWVTQDVLRELNERKLSIEEFQINANLLVDLIKKVTSGEITHKSAREVFNDLLAPVGSIVMPSTRSESPRAQSEAYESVLGSPVAEISVDRIDQIIQEKGLAIVSDTGELEGIVNAVIERNRKTVEDFQREISHIRTGRASVTLLDGIRVDYYGSLTPLNQLSKLTTPDATLIVLQPFDPAMIAPIEKAIQTADLGLNPSNDGKVIRIPIPPLTEERRKEMVKHLHQVLESHKTAARNIRRDAKDAIQKLLKDKKVGEDDEHRGLDDLEKATHEYTGKMDTLSKAKEKEVMEI
ncbi:MAG: Asp-tRNA(Asn)/Glu-tRNA(Gln) amidotransferase subunit GatB, partial [Planctomycetes bacterium]|nr:Asp-tRNA(Asn)/Glu-tRNA(Gln) amidotransferase subunit GatB [Planctomycetota bacterium]